MIHDHALEVPPEYVRDRAAEFGFIADESEPKDLARSETLVDSVQPREKFIHPVEPVMQIENEIGDDECFRDGVEKNGFLHEAKSRDRDVIDLFTESVGPGGAYAAGSIKPSEGKARAVVGAVAIMKDVRSDDMGDQAEILEFRVVLIREPDRIMDHELLTASPHDRHSPAKPRALPVAVDDVEIRFDLAKSVVRLDRVEVGSLPIRHDRHSFAIVGRSVLELNSYKMKSFPRGIAPELLLTQVENTMPYLFTEAAGELVSGRFPPAGWVREFARAPGELPDHFDYFRLCLSSHLLTCGTPVPTDVDNQIRQKLWPAGLPLDTATKMAELVLESHEWDFTLVSTRFVYGAAGSPVAKEALSGLYGEWFTVACGAYCALGRYREPEAAALRGRVFTAIEREVDRHSEIFGSLWRAKDGVGCLKASASVAHNFGDLDRVMDMWELGVGDPLRLRFYKLGARPFDTERKLRYLGRLWVAGELYKSKIEGSSMAIENHRHFGLRKARGLRSRADLVVPTAPFFDEWGGRVAGSEHAPEIVEILKESWDRQPGTYAYGRALRGALDADPGLRANRHIEAAFLVPAQAKVLETPRASFESRWAEEALRLMDDIPSRAE